MKNSILLSCSFIFVFGFWSASQAQDTEVHSSSVGCGYYELNGTLVTDYYNGGSITAASVHHRPEDALTSPSADVVIAGSALHPGIAAARGNLALDSKFVLAASVHHPPRDSLVLAGSVHHPDKLSPRVSYSFDHNQLKGFLSSSMPYVVHHGIETEISHDGYEAALLGFEALTVAVVGSEEQYSKIQLSELTALINEGPSKSKIPVLFHGNEANYNNIGYISKAIGASLDKWDIDDFPNNYIDLIDFAKKSDEGTIVIGLRPEDIAKNSELNFVDVVDTEGHKVTAAGPITIYVKEDLDPNSIEGQLLKNYWREVKRRIVADRASGRPIQHAINCTLNIYKRPILMRSEILSDRGSQFDFSAIQNRLTGE